MADCAMYDSWNRFGGVSVASLWAVLLCSVGAWWQFFGASCWNRPGRRRPDPKTLGQHFIVKSAEDKKPTKRRWFRFALRTMFVVLTFCALGSYWLARPTILAHQFVAAFKAGDYAKAESMFALDSENGRVLAGQFGTKRQRKRTTISIAPITWWHFLSLKRDIYVEVPDGEGMMEMDRQFGIEVAPEGLKLTYLMTG